MGGTASKVGKAFGLVSDEGHDDSDNRIDLQQAVAGVKVSAHVWTRASAQFFDEDGHIAHQFYEEVEVAPNKWIMREISRAFLKPVGRIFLKTPDLHVDSNIVLCPMMEGDALGS
eukprot:scpid94842/ scgid25846/ 